jgi:cytochrome c oxidase subunit 3
MRHPYHLVERSPWPFLISLNLLFFLIGFVCLLSGYKHAETTYFGSLILVLTILIFWFNDIMSESIYIGAHSYKVSRGLILGFLYFGLTEIMLFFSLFWGYFHSALNPTYLIWPPIGIDLINPWSVPLLNTFLLLYSGIACTWAHHSFLSNTRSNTLFALGVGIILGLIFVFFQGFEYYNASYDISDSVYASAFFLTTGAHGLHVMMGLTFLIVVWFRVFLYHSPNLIFDLALLYWHGVDIIWILLFILIYYLGY